MIECVKCGSEKVIIINGNSICRDHLGVYLDKGGWYLLTFDSKCPICSQEFDSPKIANKHLESEHKR